MNFVRVEERIYTVKSCKMKALFESASVSSVIDVGEVVGLSRSLDGRISRLVCQILVVQWAAPHGCRKMQTKMHQENGNLQEVNVHIRRRSIFHHNSTLLDLIVIMVFFITFNIILNHYDDFGNNWHVRLVRLWLSSLLVRFVPTNPRPPQWSDIYIIIPIPPWSPGLISMISANEPTHEVSISFLTPPGDDEKKLV